MFDEVSSSSGCASLDKFPCEMAQQMDLRSMGPSYANNDKSMMDLDLDFCSNLIQPGIRCGSEAVSSSTSNNTENRSCSCFDIMDVTSHQNGWNIRVERHGNCYTLEEAKEDDSQEECNDEQLQSFMHRLRQMMFMRQQGSNQVAQPLRPLLRSFDLEGVADLIRSGRAKRIICMCGAGISVSAGIPDFRSPGTGLYSQLEKYNLPRPEAVFEINFFRENPNPFFMLAKELFPGQYKPTATHHFMKLLSDKGLLLRCFTQNIDSLETLAGLPRHTVVPAHGNFDSAHCIDCHMEHSVDYVRQCVMADKICRCSTCGGLVKPDIVFFGESLPEAFFHCRDTDFPECDLLIVMGTSLVVQPFADLIDDVASSVPRLLINREKVGECDPWFCPDVGFNFDPPTNYRDALFMGNCDDGVRQLASLLGWQDELEALASRDHCSVPEAKSML